MKAVEKWGISSVGRAPHWQCGGQRFEPAMLHQDKSSDLFCCKMRSELFIFHVSGISESSQGGGGMQLRRSNIEFEQNKSPYTHRAGLSESIEFSRFFTPTVQTHRNAGGNSWYQ